MVLKHQQYDFKMAIVQYNSLQPASIKDTLQLEFNSFKIHGYYWNSPFVNNVFGSKRFLLYA